ncbi:MAG: hypothetical protein M3Q23_00405 [Actinomycetota bacterium]|nr:hypothetical protein [Actinomycetota bacterium]
MELSEAAQRILKRHAALIVILVVVCGAGAYALHAGQPTMYRATARLVLDAPDPQSGTESAAIADTARAIVTGPTQVQQALRTVGVHRDSIEFAKHDVTLEALGTSGVLALSVRDTSPRVASQLANTLATGLIQARVRVGAGRVDQALTDLRAQIADLSRQATVLDFRINGLNGQIAVGGSPEDLAALRAQRDDLVQQRDALAQQRANLQSEQATIESANVLRPEAAVVDRATPPPAAEPSRWPTDSALGVLLGLVLGVGAASVLESFRPTVIGRDGFVRELGAPVIGELPGPPSELDGMALATVAGRLRLAAVAAEVDRIEMIFTDQAQFLSEFGGAHAASPDEPLRPEGAKPYLAPLRFDRANGRFAAYNGDGASHGTVALAELDRPRALAPAPPKVGAVLIVPTAIRRRELISVTDLLTLANWPLLGVITYRRGRVRGRVLARRRHARHNGADPDWSLL